jgi:hypothetical protein
METRGLSFDDATRVMTVAAAFNVARNNGATTEAIDQLTSRLNSSRLTINTEIRSSSHASSAPISSSPNKQSAHITRKDCAGAISPTALTKKNIQSKGKSDKASRTAPKGKKRALAEKAATTQARTEDANKSSADIEVKEKLLNAKLKDNKRAKSPEVKPRAKRASVQQLDESQPKKRVRASSDAASCSTNA